MSKAVSVHTHREGVRLWAADLNDKAEPLDLTFRGLSAATDIGALALTQSSPGLNNMRDFLGTARSGLGLVRTIVNIAEVAGGSLEKSFAEKAFMLLTLQVTLLTGRILSLLGKIHRNAPYLGNHAKGMGIATSCCFAIVNTLDFAMTLRAYHECPKDKKEEYGVKLAGTVLELGCIVSDCGFWLATSLAGAIVTALLNLLTSGIKLYHYCKYSYLLKAVETAS